ncbi:DinB family protein [Desulfovibrio cuneatus]|uniref:DinB family protein n=1 Tax=Desulfovibrio cuneatus TaxID=159728 RepID=UPI00041E97EA|nr:DinB family protein [Desulfovibrio cuneatus]
MSNPQIAALAQSFERAHGLFLQFVDVCPDDLWASTFGGWPVWQQVAHTFGAYDYFTHQEGDAPFTPLCSREVVGLTVQGTEVISKQAIKEFATQAKTRADAYLARLTLNDLTKRNVGFSNAAGKELDHAFTIGLLATHVFYHLGTCDAGLRERGLPGLY